MESICKFCNKPASYEPIERMEEFSIKVFFCHPCQAEYLRFYNVFKDELSRTSSVSLYTKINGKTYRWTWQADGNGQLWHVKNPGTPGRQVNEGMEAIYYVEKENVRGLNITPQNIESRVRSWLLFL